jgi:hypothetical protein
MLDRMNIIIGASKQVFSDNITHKDMNLYS